ncbi:MAG: prolyl oligopeptidase family serine peptidase [Bacteroidales bacterium]
MKKSVWMLALGLLLLVTSSFAQKKPLDFSVYDNWQYIEDYQITADGEWLFYEQNPYEGDGKLVVYNVENKQETTTFPRGTKGTFNPTSAYIAYTIKPYSDTIRTLKLNDTPKGKLPKDSLGIYVLGSNTSYKVPNIQKIAVPEKNGEWMAYLYEEPKEAADSTEKEEKKSTFDKTAPDTYTLAIVQPTADKKHLFPSVTEVTLSEDGERIGFITLQNDTLLKSTLQVFDTKKETSSQLFEQEGLAKKLTLDHKNGQLAFLFTADSSKTKVYSLYFKTGSSASPGLLVDTLTAPFTANWTASENGSLYFSENDERLFFGVAPKPEPEPEDTLLESEKVRLDVWNWRDDLLQPQQLKRANREKKRTYLSVYHIKDNKLVQLEDENLRDVQLVLDGNHDLALGTDEQPYMRQQSWEMPPYADYYLVNIKTGERKIVKKEIQSYFNISPEGNYLYWYQNADSSWYAYDIASATTRHISMGMDVNLYNEEHDYPSDPSPYFFAGWTKDDKAFLVYDKYDIWRLDPKGKKAPECVTNGYGRENEVTFRYLKLDEELDYVPTKSSILLSGFNNSTKASGYYKVDASKEANPEALIVGDYRYFPPKKSRETNQVVWRRSSAVDYPDLFTSNLNFDAPTQVSKANPQQEAYNWATVELVKWTTTEGTTEEGLLYKPEDFDPNKKYPMMVYFYRLSSDGLHNHRAPRPSRSVINPTFYASNGYLVFIPNIRYKEGYPGESAYNYIVSGTLSLVESRPYIDKARMALQGQSWGGYQVAYIITKTDMYAAASAGAPVTNMTSAYGGIRWGTGMSRMFQYEETQSRIGGTLWERPLQYIENSPVFYAPKVQTPLLMRHNDGDGAVPWYQGIEYFVALRRLNKPVWMLNYNDAPHNERDKSPNTKDLSIRMMQFFNHYLKDAPAPRWMTEGIPATQKGKTMGYELMNKE